MATIKQRKAIAEITENHRSVSAAMKKAGYSPNSYSKPSNLTNTKAFREYLEEAGITDEKLAQRLNEGLDATKAIVMGTKSEESFVDVVPDFPSRHKYIETSLKLKGHAQEGTTNNIVVMPILGGVSVPNHDGDTEADETKPED